MAINRRRPIVVEVKARDEWRGPLVVEDVAVAEPRLEGLAVHDRGARVVPDVEAAGHVVAWTRTVESFRLTHFKVKFTGLTQNSQVDPAV